MYNASSATAKYTDRRGDGKTAMGVSDNAVIVNTDNRAPEFKDQPSSLTIGPRIRLPMIALGNIHQPTTPTPTTI